MTLRFLVVCEAAADFRVASDLADRVVRAHIDWLDESLLAGQREWCQFEPGRPFVLWNTDIRSRLDEWVRRRGGRSLRPRSRFGGLQGAPDAAAADKVLQFATLLAGTEALAGVLLIRDSDGDPSRRRGLEQARASDSQRPWPFQVVIGLAEPKREAWVLAGFEPRDGDERQRLDELRRELGCDPCTRSAELSARSPGSKRDIKRVLERLTGGDFNREEICWRCAPLASLIQRGEANGLASYLDEVERLLVPIFRSRRPV